MKTEEDYFCDDSIGEIIADWIFILGGIFQIVFLLFKLTKLVTWSWTIVFMPAIIIGGFVMFVFISVFIIVLFNWDKTL